MPCDVQFTCISASGSQIKERDVVSLFDESERPFVEAIQKIVYCNPFVPERVKREEEALGDEFSQVPKGYKPGHTPALYPNIRSMSRRAKVIVRSVKERLASSAAHSSTWTSIRSNDCSSGS